MDDFDGMFVLKVGIGFEMNKAINQIYSNLLFDRIETCTDLLSTIEWFHAFQADRMIN